MSLVARLGLSRVVTRPGDRRLWVLGADEALLWELNGLTPDREDLANLLAERFRLPHDRAQSVLEAYLMSWRSAGLLQDEQSTASHEDIAPWEDLLRFPPPARVASQPDDGLLLSVGQQAVILRLADEGLRSRMLPLLGHLCEPRLNPGHDSVADVVAQTGAASDWQLAVNGARLMEGDGQDQAVVAVLKILSEIGCRTAERLLVVHGAGLVSPAGHCLIVAATGGAGKTTLAVALESQGYRILSDDVVPIDREGAAVGLGLPACIKSGSWQVLKPFRPDLAAAVNTSRYGQVVRYLPPQHPVVSAPCLPRLLLFPSYSPDRDEACQLLTPEEALQRLVAADAVIRDITQAKLEQLCRWVSSMPAYAIAYPNLESGMARVQRLLERLG